MSPLSRCDGYEYVEAIVAKSEAGLLASGASQTPVLDAGVPGAPSACAGTDAWLGSRPPRGLAPLAWPFAAALVLSEGQSVTSSKALNILCLLAEKESTLGRAAAPPSCEGTWSPMAATALRSHGFGPGARVG
mmetsp:Transcript_24984/g.83734  ORF Transcript_24984/g.83734 Transcript_24984/m.83734 type:complete len:133 (+) Transcript_24984:148-546(+)